MDAMAYTFPFSLIHLSLIGSAGEFDLSRFTPLHVRAKARVTIILSMGETMTSTTVWDVPRHSPARIHATVCPGASTRLWGHVSEHHMHAAAQRC